MKASFITGYGGPEVIRFGELPEPLLTKDKVLIRVKATSVNPIDCMIRNGVIKLLTGSKFPKVLGFDFSGAIEEPGRDVIEFKKGDRVYGTITPFLGKPGALSEFICVSQKRIRKIPDGMTFDEAAAIQIASLTALNGLRNCGDLNGKKLLVNGATGGVGHFSVQIGKAKCAMVTAVCSAKNRDLAEKLGAIEVIDYAMTDLAHIDKTYDVILDAFGKMKLGTTLRLLKKGGVYASTLFLPPAMISATFARLVHKRKLTSANMRAKPEDYREIEKLFMENKLKPFIGAVFTPENTRLAFEMIEQGRTRGKTIVKWD